MADSWKMPGSSPPNAAVEHDAFCARCGSNLRGLPIAGNCMVCARPVSESVRAVSAPFVFDPAAPIDADLACRNCGYNLRGLTLGALCPECGRPVLNSARGDQLRYCDAAWVRTLSRGSRLVVVGATLWMLGFVAAIFGVGALSSMASNSIGAEDWLRVVGGLLLIGAGLCIMGGPVVSYVGAWLITAREPAAPETGGEIRARSIVRWGLLLLVFNWGFSFVAAGLPGLSPTVRIAMMCIVIAIQLFNIFAVHSYFQWLSKLCDRLPDAALSRSAKNLSFWLAGLMFFPTLLVSAMSLMSRTGLGAPGARSGSTADGVLGILACPSCCSAIAFIFVFLAAVRTQQKLGRQLSSSAKEAALNAEGGGAIPEARAVAE